MTSRYRLIVELRGSLSENSQDNEVPEFCKSSLMIKLKGRQLGVVRLVFYVRVFRFPISHTHTTDSTDATFYSLTSTDGHSQSYLHPMALLTSIFGFSLFGLGARIGQLGIQKRNLFESAFSFPYPPPAK